MTSLESTIKSWANDTQDELEERGQKFRDRTRDFAKALPYAALGATVYSVEKTREAAQAAFEFPSRVVKKTMKTPKELSLAFADRVERGRRAVARIQGREAVQEANEEFDSAKSDLKATANTARRTVETAAEAVEEAVEATFNPLDTRPYEDRTYEELRQLASDREITGRSSMNKQGLISALRAER